MEGTDQSAPRKKKRKPCPRCGDFTKTTKVGGRRLCLACLDRSDPIERDPILITTLLAGGVALAARSAGGWIPLALPIAVIEVAVGLAFPEATAPNLLIGAAMGWVATLLMVSIRCELGDAVVASSPLPSAGALLGRAFGRLGALSLTYLVTSLITGAYSLLLVIPGILRAIDFQLAMPIVVLEGATTNEALRLSTERMRGSRLVVTLSSILASLPVFAALAGVALLSASSPQFSMIVALLQLVMHTALHLIPFVSLALYFKLRWQAAREKLAPSST